MLETHESNLGDEKWDVTEQLFYACIDIGNNDLAESYLQKLSEQFPGKLLIKSIFVEKNLAEKIIFAQYFLTKHDFFDLKIIFMQQRFFGRELGFFWPNLEST